MVELKKKQYAIGTLSVTDKNGDAAQVEAGSIRVASSNEDVATVEYDESTGEVKVTSVGIGAAVISVEADADLGEGVTPLRAEAAVEVTPLEASNLGISFGPAQDVPQTEEPAPGGEEPADEQ